MLGRFIQADTIVPESGNPQSLNRYSYVYNNPVRYTDPTGHCAIEIPQCESVLAKSYALGIHLRNQVNLGGVTPVEAFITLAAFVEQSFIGINHLLPKDHQNSLDNTMWAMTILLLGTDPNKGSSPIWSLPLPIGRSEGESKYWLGQDWLSYNSEFADLTQQGDWRDDVYDGTANQAYHFWFYVAVAYYDGPTMSRIGNRVHDPKITLTNSVSPIGIGGKYLFTTDVSIEDWALGALGVDLGLAVRNQSDMYPHVLPSIYDDFTISGYIRDNLQK